MPEKKLHSSGTRKDAEGQRNKDYANKLSKMSPVRNSSDLNTVFHRTSRTVASNNAIPAKSSIKRADKEGRYKK
jgi:hypothetical protein